MNRDELARFLNQSLADRRLSGSENCALVEWVAAHVKTDQEAGVARHVAFEVARSAVADPAARDVVGWIEEVLKILAPIQQQQVADSPRLPERDRAFFSPGERCLNRIILRFEECRRTADVCVFTITDNRISDAIIEAHRRGVKVRIVTDEEKQRDAGSDIGKFLQAGVSVKFDSRRSGRPDLCGDGHMHHKFALFDGTRLLNGSYNWTRGAAESNYENLIESGSPELIDAFAEEFKRLWNRF